MICEQTGDLLQGKDGAAIFIFFAGDVEKKGLPITKDGRALVKKYAYIAAVCYDQMEHRGKHHVQAVCCCAAHLLDRVRPLLRHRPPYQLRHLDGTPLTREEARTIIAEGTTSLRRCAGATASGNARRGAASALTRSETG